jgi:hypothetical protein
MKDYSNSSRKPMMYGGMAKKKAMGGGMATSASGMTSPTMVAQKAQRQAQQPRTGMGGSSTPPMTMSQGGSTDDTRRAEIKAQFDRGGKDRAAVMAMANGKGRDATIARSVIREAGGAAGAAAMPSGDKEPTTKMYGGMAKKKKS